MKRLLIMVATALCLMQACVAQDTASKLDSLVSAYAKTERFNGSALVAKNGAVLLNNGYGYRNTADKVLNNAQTIFQLGSVTKQFTAAVILKLQEEKKLSVSDKLSKFFPDYPKGDSITIRELLSHTSGIPNYTNDKNFMKNEITKPASREKMMALFENKPLDFSPGTSWNYSNSGYSMLGYIIEKVTKMPYEEVVRQYIFTPLHMIHSGFDFTHLKSNDKAVGYFQLAGKEGPPAPIVDSTVSFSAGAIYSTTGDLYLWSQALEHNTVLSKEQQEAAYTPVRNNYGYGWVIDSIEGKRRVEHTGSIPGFMTIISRVPQDDVCIILLSNASNTSLNDISKNIYAILYNKAYELPKVKMAIKLPEEMLKQYEGEYEIKPGFTVVIKVKDDWLEATPTGQSPKMIYPAKEDSFFEKAEDIQVEFTRNDQKKVDGFILHQGGAKIPAKKIK